MSLLPVEEAMAAILRRVPAPTPETVPLHLAAGRVLLEPLVAQHNQPPFDASAMDGYAVRADDVVPEHNLTVVGTSQAGSRFMGHLQPGQAVRIFTGAPVPESADTVIMQEDAVLNAGTVSFRTAPRKGHSVRPMGNDFAAGQQLIASGEILSPMRIAVAAAANAPQVTVSRRPRIALLATGDELVLPGSPLGPDQIVASNSFGLAPLLAQYADAINDFGIVRDDPEKLGRKLTEIFADEPDVLITTGGASVGDHDIVQDLLVEHGVSLDFWRINMRPGKPLMFGMRGKTLIFGLPGNPVSAMVTAIAFVKPALRRWLGYDGFKPWHLPLAAPTPPNTARKHFMRAQLVQSPNGLQALPISQTDSGHTSSLSLADLLIVQPEFDVGQPAGSVVEAIPINAF